MKYRSASVACAVCATVLMLGAAMQETSAPSEQQHALVLWRLGAADEARSKEARNDLEASGQDRYGIMLQAIRSGSRAQSILADELRAHDWQRATNALRAIEAAGMPELALPGLENRNPDIRSRTARLLPREPDVDIVFGLVRALQNEPVETFGGENVAVSIALRRTLAEAISKATGTEFAVSNSPSEEEIDRAITEGRKWLSAQMTK